MKNGSKERRKHPRIYRNFILIYHEKGKSTPKHNVSQINDVSKGGLNFSSTHPLKEGDLLRLVLKTPFIEDYILLEGVVLGCKEKITEMIYEIRLQFQDIPEQSLKILEKIDEYARKTESKG